MGRNNNHAQPGTWRAAQAAEKRHTVWVWNCWPGRRMVEGKFGWLTASGNMTCIPPGSTGISKQPAGGIRFCLRAQAAGGRGAGTRHMHHTGRPRPPAAHRLQGHARVLAVHSAALARKLALQRVACRGSPPC